MMVVQVTVADGIAFALNKSRSFIWSGQPTQWILEHLDGRDVAYFHAGDNRCIFPSNMVPLIREATQKEYDDGRPSS